MPPVVVPTASSLAGASHQPARSVAATSATLQAPFKHAAKPSVTAINVVAPNGASTSNVAERLERLEERERIQSSGAASTSRTGGVSHRAPAEKCWELSLGWHQLPHHLTKQELWYELRSEALQHARAEPILASNLHSSILVHSSLEESLAFILANKLSSPTLLSTNLMQLIQQAYEEDPGLVDAAVADMQAVRDRDPACLGFSQVLLWFKGFQAIQSQRVAHWLWKHQRKPLALALQSRISAEFQVDIHPAAYLGRGLMMDHATGVVIGETAVIGDNVSMLHHVTIGGSGIRSTIRHPTIGHGVLLGAGATVLGPINIGSGSKIGSGSVVVTSLPPKCVAVGVPARVIKQDRTLDPCQSMDQADDFVLYFEI